MKNGIIKGFFLRSVVLVLVAMFPHDLFSEEDSDAASDSVSVVCTPPKREVCGPVHPGPGPIICRCV